MKKRIKLIRDWFCILFSGMFDRRYYLNNNIDVKKSRFSHFPLLHFLKYGGAEGRNPSEEFNSAYYYNRYPDVKKSGMNPLTHYVRFGKKEKRICIPQLSQEEEIHPLPKTVLRQCSDCLLVLDFLGGGGTGVYVNNLLQNSIPATKTVIHARYNVDTDTIDVIVFRDDHFLGNGAYNDTKAFFQSIASVTFSDTIVNNLVTWPSIRTVLDCLTQLKRSQTDMQISFRLHDFFCVCPSFALMDESKKFCSVRCDEAACASCVNYENGIPKYLDRDNIQKFSVTKWRQMWGDFLVNTADSVIAFSPSSMDVLLRAYPNVKNNAQLVPHEIPSFNEYRIAIVGNLAVHKGSEVLFNLVNFLDRQRIKDMKIHHFGAFYDAYSGIQSPNFISHGSYQRSELSKLLKKNQIDIVFIPSICPETFCYTAGESLALGYTTACFDIGGQADQVRCSDNGIILTSQDPFYLYRTFKKCITRTPAVEAATMPTETTPAVRTVVVQDRTSREFLNYMFDIRKDKSEFVPKDTDSIVMKPSMPKVIAVYLPQFHEFKENVEWFGPGFTEWTNTSQTLPQFIGHRQPHVPVDVGYYDLTHTDAMYRQAALAKQYGISGFSVYYYWFSGKKLMEKPMERLLADKNLDFPFFFFWANEQWTRAWGNGADREVLVESKLQPGDAERFMEDVLPYMKDHRYMKVGNKPILIIYKLLTFPKEDFLNFIRRIRQIAKENGFDDLYISGIVNEWMDADHLENVQKEFLLDALTEFHPFVARPGLKKLQQEYVDPSCRSTRYDVEDYVESKKYLRQTKANLFTGLYPNWDNSPRRYDRGAHILQSTPELYKQWLADLIQWTKKNHTQEESFIFINAWNEWAEGAYMEPDTHYGYAYLKKTREALEESESG